MTLAVTLFNYIKDKTSDNPWRPGIEWMHEPNPRITRLAPQADCGRHDFGLVCCVRPKFGSPDAPPGH
jgi:hypothetical protein